MMAKTPRCVLTVVRITKPAENYTIRLQIKQLGYQREEIDHMKARAELSIDVRGSSEPYETEAPGGPKDASGFQEMFPASYVCIIVTNLNKETPARGCLAKLLRIREITEEDSPEFRLFPGPIRLRESFEEDYPPTYQGAEIRHNSPVAFDLMSVKDEKWKDKEGNEKHSHTFIQSSVDHAKYRILANKLKHGHSYRFSVSITAENADSLTVEVEVKIGEDSKGLRLLRDALWSSDNPNQHQGAAPAKPRGRLPRILGGFAGS